MQSDGQCRPAQALLPSDRPTPLSWPGHRPGAGGGVRGGSAPQPQDGPRYLVRWQGHTSAADSWEPAEHLANCQERVAEYEAAAPRRLKALGAHQRAGTVPLAQTAAPPPPAAAPPPTQPPPGWDVAAVGPPGSASPSSIGPGWQDEGWQLAGGRIRRRCRRAPLAAALAGSR